MSGLLSFTRRAHVLSPQVWYSWHFEQDQQEEKKRAVEKEETVDVHMALLWDALQCV